jgi:hypothetical protein
MGFNAMDLKKMIKIGLQTLIPCLFFGWTLIAIAAGSIYPPINRIAKPFVCPRGTLDFEQTGYRPSPGTTVTTTTWVCTDARSGTEKVIGVMALTIPAGLIDGLIAFVAVMAIVAAVQYRRGKYPRLEKAAAARQEELETIQRMEREDLATPSANGVAMYQQLIFDGRDITAMASEVRQMGGKVKQAAEELTQLKQLLSQGLITQQDYDQKKAEILKRL